MNSLLHSPHLVSGNPPAETTGPMDLTQSPQGKTALTRPTAATDEALQAGGEVILGIVAPVGVNRDGLASKLGEFAATQGYRAIHHKISRFIEEYSVACGQAILAAPYPDRILALIRAGNDIRQGSKDGVGLLAVQGISAGRPVDADSNPKEMLNTIHLVDSFKNPEEVRLFQATYGSAFYLIGLSASGESRIEWLRNAQGVQEEEARKLIDRDELEGEAYQQRTRDTFELADVFVEADSRGANQGQLQRALDLIFSHPFITPTRDEHGMFLAYTASLRSVSLSRQVGAAIISAKGDVLALGWNDAPKHGGGLCDRGEGDHSDHTLGYDSNDLHKNRMMELIVAALRKDVPEVDRLKLAKEALKETGLLDLTEYGRDVHAEMEALLSAARNGISILDATLYSTTLPCHNCAKHIVAAGLKEVVFVEPYPKSRAFELFSDSITMGKGNPSAVAFRPFIGVGSRRYFDLFSMKLGSGEEIVRKQDGKAVDSHQRRRLRTPSDTLGYLQREQALAQRLPTEKAK